jgi:hypothetical protein
VTVVVAVASHLADVVDSVVTAEDEAAAVEASAIVAVVAVVVEASATVVVVEVVAAPQEAVEPHGEDAEVLAERVVACKTAL